MHQRVCLEQSSVVGAMMLYRRWKTLGTYLNCAEVERTELADKIKYDKRDKAFRRRSSEIVCKSPYAAGRENAFGGER